MHVLYNKETKNVHDVNQASVLIGKNQCKPEKNSTSPPLTMHEVMFLSWRYFQLILKKGMGCFYSSRGTRDAGSSSLGQSAGFRHKKSECSSLDRIPSMRYICMLHAEWVMWCIQTKPLDSLINVLANFQSSSWMTHCPFLLTANAIDFFVLLRILYSIILPRRERPLLAGKSYYGYRSKKSEEKPFWCACLTGNEEYRPLALPWNEETFS